MKDTQPIPYDILFPGSDDLELLQQASSLTERYSEEGLMLKQSVDALSVMAAQGMLALAVHKNNNEQTIIGSVALTFEWPSAQELGAWAVRPDLISMGIGKNLLIKLFQEKGFDLQVIALANENSAPIFEKMGAVELNHDEVDQEVFEPCQTCNCDKSRLKPGEQCVDKIYDLTGVIENLKKS